MKKILVIVCVIIFSSFLGGQSSYAEANRKAEYKKNGLAIWEVKTKEKVVALTFQIYESNSGSIS